MLRTAVSVAILIFAPLFGRGAITERSAPNGTSPDRKYEVVEAGDNNSPIGTGYDIELRERGHKEVLGKCECGYGNLKIDEDFTVVLWSSHGPFVAIKARDGKRNFSTTIFYLNGKNTKKIKPDIDYFQNICGRLGTLGDHFRNTIETPIQFVPGKWGGDDMTLKVEVPSLKDDVELAFDVTISCIPPFSNWNSGDPEPHARVVGITGPVPHSPNP